MHRMTDEEFEAAIEEALDAMPEQFLDALENIAIVWEDEPSAYHLGLDDEGDVASWQDASECEDEPLPDDLLGLFDGLSLVERAEGGYDDDIPDVITIFKGPHERCFSSREEIVEEIGKTVVHELGHYFGLNEDQLAAMGCQPEKFYIFSLSSTNWATTSASTKSASPPWATNSKGDFRPRSHDQPMIRSCPGKDRAEPAWSGGWSWRRSF